MKTILVPVDFSASSHNAAAYSVDLANGRAFDEIVLMANIHISLLEQFLPNPDLIQLSAEDSQRRKKLLLHRLEELKFRLLKKLTPGILIRVILSELPLIRSILEQVKKNGACLVVIGSNSAKIEGSSIASSLLNLLK
jgi:nucleotide-binding universal stress UspA family protein